MLNRYKNISPFWFVLLLILVLSSTLRLLSYDYALPYVEHLDEPNYYLAGLGLRGLYDDDLAYAEGAPPGYLYLHYTLQPVLESAGIHELADTVRVFRLISVVANLGTAIVIALAARLVAGNIAGLVAAAAWGISPAVLENGVYAIPDPLGYFFTALALWLALGVLLKPERASWSLWSVAAGLLAVIMKYPLVPALLPGGIVALVITSRDHRQGLRLLAIQAVMVAVVGILLVFVYGVDFNNLQGRGAVVQEQGLTNLVNMQRLLNNIQFSLVPLNRVAALAILGLGGAAWLVALQRGTKRVPGGAVGLALLLLVTIPWLANTYALVGTTSIRYVMPATTAACVLLGMALAQIVDTVVPSLVRLINDRFLRWQSEAISIPGSGIMWGQVIAVVLLTIVVFIPQLDRDWRLVQQRRIPDRRVELRQWVDTNLEPGTVIVYEDNHKTFNPFWGGIPYQHWVDWWITDKIMEHPVAEWRDQRGMSYAAIDLPEWERMQATTEGQAYLDQMLHLRDFTAPPQRTGPQIIFYRLWKPQTALDVRFGNHIRLVGYDQSTTEAHPGDEITFRFYWNAPTTPDDNYSLFLHLTSLDSLEPQAQADGAPAVVERPTLTWNEPSETLISPQFQLVLPPDFPPGQYQVRVGLYNYLNGERLLVFDNEDLSTGDSLALTQIEVQE